MFKAGTRPNIVLITLDTTRADRMGFLGSKLGLTPNLDEVARQGIVFTHAFSHVPLTTASHASLLTGTYPQFNHVNDFSVPLSPRLPYLPDLLGHGGYHTGAFVGSLILDPLDGTAPGFDRGFEVYDAGFRLRRHGMDRYGTVERRAGVVVDHALGWLSQLHNPPFFLWVHLYDAHDPYDPPPPFKQRFTAQPYDGEIAYADSALGKLFRELRKHGLFDETLIAVMADHGESLGAHGENTHGIFLYEETLHVPLLIKLPLHRAAGRRVESRVGLVDVAPTLLEEAGLAVPKEMQGESLLSLISSRPGEAGVKRAGQASAGTQPPDRPAYAESDYPHRAFGWSPLRALRTGKYLYIQAPARELYDQTSDPRDMHNLAASARAVADTLSFQLDQFRQRTSRSLVELAKPDAEQIEKLQALGYVGSEAGAKPEADPISGADPKAKIDIANLLHDAMLDVEDARYEQAIPRLERVLEQAPDMPVANLQYGMAEARLYHYDKAIGPLEKAVKMQPDNGMGHYELGLALYETGDWKGAAPEFEAAVARAPRWADAQFSLAAVYARIDRLPEALQHLALTLALNPDHYRANLLRGRILSLEGNPVEALPNLKKAVEVEPDSREAHLFLAEAYAQLGQTLEAQHERDAADRLSVPK
ncbi:MAG TPA: sulfatase-like hydrolase/transferase [Terriglobales bacterium]|nr:sulfatase-like hydrolase/transferase [Terriglobales bacterium]